jgi:hypothetical protein
VFVSSAAACSARDGQELEQGLKQELFPDGALSRIPADERTLTAGLRYDSNLFSDALATGAYSRADRHCRLDWPVIPTSSMN